MNEAGVDFAYRDSVAARLLAAGLAHAAKEEGLSQRSLAKRLGYKQSVVLSHMALGRVPVPLERAGQLADLLGIDKREFLMAVLAQRVPDVDWATIFAPSTVPPSHAGEFASSLEVIARGALDELNSTQKAVMREVVRDDYASERWLSVHELPIMVMLRSLRPAIVTEGLTSEDRDAIIAALQDGSDDELPPSSF